MMLAPRVILSTAPQATQGHPEHPARRTTSMRTALAPFRAYSVNKISHNLKLISTHHAVRLEKDARRRRHRTPRVVQTSSKPLVVILSWLKAKPANVMKYATFYLERGFDVLTVRVHVWQCVWPVKGIQAVATELLEFLRLNYTSVPLIVHGFSVGGYLWGEVCWKASENVALYRPVLDRIVGQVWDSVVLSNEFRIGMSHTIFPHSTALQIAMDRYTKYHMRMFHELATKHYLRSGQMFHNNMLRAPALFLVSKADRIGSAEGNRRVHDNWASLGVQTYWKCWDKSPHVAHFQEHPEEYAAELSAFLNLLRIVQNPNKFPRQDDNILL